MMLVMWRKTICIFIILKVLIHLRKLIYHRWSRNRDASINAKPLLLTHFSPSFLYGVCYGGYSKDLFLKIIHNSIFWFVQKMVSKLTSIKPKKQAKQLKQYISALFWWKWCVLLCQSNNSSTASMSYQRNSVISNTLIKPNSEKNKVWFLKKEIHIDNRY